MNAQTAELSLVRKLKYTFTIYCKYLIPQGIKSCRICREENQLDITECFIVIIIRSTCFGYSYAHRQELETILVLLPHMVCNALDAGEGNC